MTLFTSTELKRWLHYAEESDFREEDAQLAEQVVAGWLSDACDLDDLDDLGETLESPRFKAWAIELGGIAYENPTTMAQDQADEIASRWQIDRRKQILDSVRAWAAARSGSTLSAPAPRGRFPKPMPWPEQFSSR